MDIITKADFTQLANFQTNLGITIYIPTHKSGVEVNEQQDFILYKNTLQRVRVLLKERGLRTKYIEELLQPGFDLADDDTFWYNLSDGLAIFIAEDYFKIMVLPITVKPKILINHSFYLTPLIPLITDNEVFYILVLSKKSAKLYQGNAFEMIELEVEGLPQGLEDVIHFEEKDAEKLFRGGGNLTGTGASFHGHGTGLADEKEYIASYLKEVDKTLRTEVLANRQVPLVLAAVEYLVAIYKQVSHYNFIADKAIVGNYENEDKQTLFKKAHKIVAPQFRTQIKKSIENYSNQTGTALTSSLVEEIIPASFYGRISDLFVLKDAHIWGKFNEADNSLTIHRHPEPNDECLLNKSVIKTILNGGHVFVLEEQEMPSESPMCALMRYEG